MEKHIRSLQFLFDTTNIEKLGKVKHKHVYDVNGELVVVFDEGESYKVKIIRRSDRGFLGNVDES